MIKLKIKVCGMKLAANIAAIAELQPNYLGFIFYQKSPRFINEVSAELIKYIPEQIKTVGVFVNEEILNVKEKISQHKLKAVQLHGNEMPEYCINLKTTFVGLEVIKAFGVDDDFDFSILNAYLDVVDYFLFDTKTKVHGGSGKAFDWKILEKYTLDKPYFLSGGIDLEHANTITKIQDDRLYALDINSRFETEPGMKDVEKVKEFITKISN